MLAFKAQCELYKYRKCIYLIEVSILLLCSSVPAFAMELSKVDRRRDQTCEANCEHWIQAEGSITAESVVQFNALVDALPVKRRITVFLSSPGGSVVGAMALGKAFRAAKANVVIASLTKDRELNLQAGARCVSACAYAFLGGVRRSLAPGSQVGLHRMVSLRNEGPFGVFQKRIYDNGSLKILLEEYVSEMGVNSEIVDVAERSRPDAIRILTAEEIEKWRIINSSK